MTLDGGTEPIEVNGLAGTDTLDDADDDNGNMTVDFGFFNPTPSIDVEKSTNGDDADASTGLELHIGDTVTWDYNITNTGTEVLINIALNDDKEGSISCPKTTLAMNETMMCQKTDTVSVLGLYENNAMVSGEGNVTGTDVNASDPSHYHVEAVSMGSVIWSDLDNDGIQDAGEPGIAGAVVTLLEANGTVVTGVPAQTTDANGTYFFDSLPEGDYKVQVDMSGVPGYTPAANQNANADDDVDNDSNIETIDNVNKIYTSGTVTLDGGTEPIEVNGLAGTDTLDDADDDNGNMTVDFGFFGLGTWSGNVSKDTNNDDNGDINLVGVTIKLFTDPNGDGDFSDGTLIGTTITDINGTYKFIDLIPGDYVAVETQPVGLLNVSENEGGADNDKVDNGIINAIAGTISVGEDDVNNDFVEEEPGSWTGNVSQDTNHNGIGDVNLANVVIKLYSDPNGDGNPSDGVLIGTTTTDSHGNYSFTNLPAGDYVTVETQPSGLQNVSENEGGSDNDKPNNGIVNAIAGHVAAGEDDIHNDFIEEKYLGSITGNVSKTDSNGNLSPIANVTLVLFDTNGNEVARTTTDANGNYKFVAPPGNYYIQESQPRGYYDVSENEGGADNESTNNLLNTINVTVGVGETDVLNDFIESTTKVGCNCTPTPVIPCAICTQGFYTIHSHNVKDHTAEVHWVDSYYEIAYDIYLNGKFIATVPEDTTRYTFKNLQSGTEYTAVIIANNGYGGKTRQTVTFKTTDGLGWLPAVYHMLSN